MATKAQVMEQFEKVTHLANELAGAVHALSKLVGDDQMVTVHAYECNRRLEDAMNRVSNMMPYIVRKTDEEVDKLVESKLGAAPAAE